MKIHKINSKKQIEKVKIPNEPRKGAALTFQSFYEGQGFEPPRKRKIIAPQTNLIPAAVSRKDKIAKRDRALEKIKAEFTPERAALLNKKGRRRFKDKFDSYEWQVFCSYVNTCRRGLTRKRRKARKQKVSYRTKYDTFIHSEEWLAIRNRYWQNHPKKCAVCDSAKFVHLHHMVYGQFGHEKDEDLIPLCKQHHEEYHAQNGTQRNMKVRTMEYVQAKRVFIPDSSPKMLRDLFIPYLEALEKKVRNQ